MAYTPWPVSLSSRSSVFDVILRVELWYCRSTEIFIKQALSHCLPDAVGEKLWSLGFTEAVNDLRVSDDHRPCDPFNASPFSKRHSNKTIRFKLIRVLSVEPNTAITLIICVKVVTYTEFHAQHFTAFSNAWNRTNTVYERKNFSLEALFLNDEWHNLKPQMSTFLTN